MRQKPITGTTGRLAASPMATPSTTAKTTQKVRHRQHALTLRSGRNAMPLVWGDQIVGCAVDQPGALEPDKRVSGVPRGLVLLSVRSRTSSSTDHGL